MVIEGREEEFTDMIHGDHSLIPRPSTPAVFDQELIGYFRALEIKQR